MTIIMWMLALAIILGILLPFQAKMSGELVRASQSSLLAGFLGVIVTFLFLGTLMLLKQQPLFLPKVPWWAYVSGVLGGMYIVGISFLSSRGSITTVMVGVLAGQMITSLLIDYYGTGVFEIKKILATLCIFLAVFLAK